MGKSRSVNLYDLNGNYIETYKSASLLARELNVGVSQISYCAREEQNKHKCIEYQIQYDIICNRTNIGKYRDSREKEIIINNKNIELLGLNKKTKNHEYYNCRCVKCNNKIIIERTRINKYKCVNCENIKNDKLIGQLFDKLTVIEQTKKRSHKSIIYKCICDCGETVYKSGRCLKSNQYNSCKKCKSWQISRNKNKTNKKIKDVEQFLKNIEDCNKIISEKETIVAICPNCNSEYYTTLHKLIYNKNKVCENCIEYLSKSEKILYEILKYCNISFEREKSFSWSKKKRYDFYLNDFNYIVELNGRQHYMDTPYFSRCELDVQRNIDIKKENMALDNGIKKYIIIDTSNSDFNNVYNKIISSELNSIINKCQINKEYIFKESQKTIESKILELYKQYENTETVANIVGYTKTYVCGKLKIATENGLCDYKRKYIQKRIVLDNIIFNGIQQAKIYCGSANIHLGEYLSKTRKTPQKYIDRGLRYYNPETDKDLPIYVDTKDEV